ncbi:MAG: preprotein translocase subunit SecD [Oscillospiraceae bacterium]|jgi:protein-export membrane protein SecD
MKRTPKPVFFIITILTVLFTVLAFTGISTTYGDIKTVIVKGAEDIRLGIDIRGGVDVTFTPPADVTDVTNDQLAAAQAVIEQRMISNNITDYEIYADTNNKRIIVRFPWKSDEENFDPETAVKELGETALLTFREGYETNEQGLPTGVTEENIILTGSDVKSAKAAIDTSNNKNEPVVQLELNESGVQKFADATTKLAAESPKGYISIWMDDTMISNAQVKEALTGGQAVISGGFTAETAQSLANKIEAGALPFELETANFSTISPTLGMGALNAMIIAGIIAFILVSIFMIVIYRLPGIIAVIALAGQMAGSIAAVSGFFPFFSSFTLTLPGIAGIILSLGMGVDANVISAERIKEEIRGGKSIDGSLNAGYSRAFTAIFDSNITMVIVAVVLMGAFGPPSSFFSTLLSPIFFMFGPVAAGTIYSFGYTLLVGVIFNFIFGVTCSKLMLKSISRFKFFRKPQYYGGDKVEGV